MNLKLINQINRVKMLSEMINEKLIQYENDTRDKEQWQKENPDKYWYPNKLRTNPTEVRRLMLVQRQEMIKLEKMI